ncbi:hypothetical protein L596_012913 [Steinernema carpocapsae]|uniref:Uncharacterized protein n=1 Tax=Steinernema carpocapsae TaxID=34508 RepID=A0A4U5NYU1_STECR|nr:hypothetical protein L596_012913 [Steinernema carpocapsae]
MEGEDMITLDLDREEELLEQCQANFEREEQDQLRSLGRLPKESPPPGPSQISSTLRNRLSSAKQFGLDIKDRISRVEVGAFEGFRVICVALACDTISESGCACCVDPVLCFCAAVAFGAVTPFKEGEKEKKDVEVTSKTPTPHTNTAEATTMLVASDSSRATFYECASVKCDLD